MENTLDRRTSFEKFTRNVVSLLPWKTSKPDGTSFSPPLHQSLLSFCFSNLTVKSVFITVWEFSLEWWLYNVFSLQSLLPSPFATDLSSHTWRNGPLGAMLFALGSMKLFTPFFVVVNCSKKSVKTCLVLFLFLVPPKILSLTQFEYIGFPSCLFFILIKKSLSLFFYWGWVKKSNNNFLSSLMYSTASSGPKNSC